MNTCNKQIGNMIVNTCNKQIGNMIVNTCNKQIGNMIVNTCNKQIGNMIVNTCNNALCMRHHVNMNDSNSSDLKQDHKPCNAKVNAWG